MKKIFTILFAGACLLTSCNLDQLPNNELTPEDLGEIEESALYVTTGNYSMFKDILKYKGEEYTGNTYVRHFFQMSEFMSDNVSLSGRTSDPLYEAATYKRNPSVRNVTYLWWTGYKVINGANNVIESLNGNLSPEMSQLKGENYFLRAIAHLNLSLLWSKPYSHGRGNVGVVLSTSAIPAEPVRSTVGEVYDQIVSDLLEAVRLMPEDGVRGNGAYISKKTAQGLLSRVYLYREENDKVIEVVNQMLAGSDPASQLEPTATLSTYYALALTSKETLWAIGHTSTESKGSSSLASMYLTDGAGWGEVFASDPLLDLLGRYSEDVRNSFIIPVASKKDPNTYTVRWAVPSKDDFYENTFRDLTLDAGQNKYYFDEGTSRIYVETEMVNTYKQNYIMLAGTKHLVHMNKRMEERNSYPKYYVTKYSYQDNNSMLSSPVMLRWAEVILNRAEAYAKSNQAAMALADVNVIRTRAGLPTTAMFSASNMHGYTDVLDVVLDEKRLELSFEGHRAHDLYRNKKSMNRKYAGAQPWEVVDFNDNKIQFYIPTDEVLESGLPQNP